jgi:predicted DNA binding CopG/RHH family protein
MGLSSAVGKRISKPIPRQRHDHVVVIKLAESLVRTIDQEAETEGLTRSAIIRRILKKKYEAELAPTP